MATANGKHAVMMWIIGAAITAVISAFTFHTQSPHVGAITESRYVSDQDQHYEQLRVIQEDIKEILKRLPKE
jgi:large-conductance mechanosensitive channel